MNSEELEQSLKTEFESYLKAVLAEMKQDTAEFQSKIEAEFEKQKSQIDEAFQGFAARFDSDRTFDAPFMGSVGEHLRLARDEGARIAADAMVEAENLGQSPMAAVPLAAPVIEPKYDAIRDAVEDISSKDTQSAILKSLVHHAANFAPRGAFFIVKAEHFLGWKVFGADDAAENAVRDIHFPIAADSVLGAAVADKSTADNAERNHPGNAAFLNPLQFGEPDRMCAVPLVARGRGVAVMYADYGAEPDEDARVNREALETIVRVAGLTVEMLASMQTAKAENRTVGAADFEDVAGRRDEPVALPAEEPQAEEPQSESFEAEQEPVSEFAEPTPEPAASPAEEAQSEKFETDAEPFSEFAEPTAEPVAETGFDLPAFAIPTIPTEEPAPVSDFAFSDSVSFEGGFPQEVASANPFDAETPIAESFDALQEVETPAAVETAFDNSPFAEEPYPGDEIMRARQDDAFGLPVETVEPQAETFDPMPETFATPAETFEPPVETFAPAVETYEAEPETFEPVAEKVEDDESKDGELIFENETSFDEVPSVSSPFDQPTEQFEPAAVLGGGGFAHHVAEPVMEASGYCGPETAFERP